MIFVRRSSYHLKAWECTNMQAYDFFQLLNKNIFNCTFKIGFFIVISWRFSKNLHCSTGLINCDDLLIFKFRNSQFDLKVNFVHNLKNSNACRFLNSYPLKLYEARHLKQLYIRSNFVEKFGPSYKKWRYGENSKA